MTERESTARRKFLVKKLHHLGEQPLFYFLREVEAETGIDLTGRLEEYAALPAEFIAAYGGRDFPPVAHVLADGDAA